MIEKTIEFNRFINGILNSNSINQKHKSHINVFILKEYGIDLSKLSSLDKLLYHASSSENIEKSKYVPLIEHFCEFFSPETKKNIINCFISNGFEGREYGTVLSLQIEPYWLNCFKNKLLSEGWNIFDVAICRNMSQ